MPFEGFKPQDFDVFTVPGLEPRMEALIENVRPKLETLGGEIAPFLSALCGEEMFPHVAKHARRTINPPNDTWVAWAANKRGYKALPHFQVGMFESHLFIIFAVIYESSNKAIFAKHLEKNLSKVKKSLPEDFYWSMDHMDPGFTPHSKMSSKDFTQMAVKLDKVKKSEVLCGLRIPRGEAVLENGPELLSVIQSTFEKLLPLYKMAF
ncbi:DUF1054 domain-containing protein [Paenibacillus sp. KQZ6P-2]|uniref:UPF0637 protein MUG84_06065 n=1 Tax=Paenibacillus mangrovi TaxID=2931978 RepID=A0A9X1WT68_9BACL|nr:DUF1054 domain-containing protein [Paenibacillus mangrovi]MCJ8011314.1 DUF1054 domain-containing protein [Paenibacillus mangrovi]